MKVVRVRAYGILPISQGIYLALQTVCFSLLLLALVAVLLIPPDLSEHRVAAAEADGMRRTAIETYVWAVENAHWILIGVIVLEVLETGSMMRKFRIAESRAASQPTGKT
jgi:hypothetical protein